MAPLVSKFFQLYQILPIYFDSITNIESLWPIWNLRHLWEFPWVWTVADKSLLVLNNHRGIQRWTSSEASHRPTRSLWDWNYTFTIITTSSFRLVTLKYLMMETCMCKYSHKVRTPSTLLNSVRETAHRKVLFFQDIQILLGCYQTWVILLLEQFLFRRPSQQ